MPRLGPPRIKDRALLAFRLDTRQRRAGGIDGCRQSRAGPTGSAVRAIRILFSDRILPESRTAPCWLSASTHANAAPAGSTGAGSPVRDQQAARCARSGFSSPEIPKISGKAESARASGLCATGTRPVSCRARSTAWAAARRSRGEPSCTGGPRSPGALGSPCAAAIVYYAVDAVQARVLEGVVTRVLETFYP